MDSRDLIIIAVLGVGAWLWWKQRQTDAGASVSTSVPGAVANPTGAASMVAGAAAQTVAGFGFAHGMFFGGNATDTTTGSVATIRAAAARNAVAKLQSAQNTPQPVAFTPRVTASSSLGVPLTPAVRPPAQRLTTALPILGLRGVR